MSDIKTGRAWTCKEDAQRIDVVASRPAAHQGSLNWRGSSTHERVVNEIVWLRKVADEKLW